MSIDAVRTGSVPDLTLAEDAKLRKAAKDLEGVFVGELYKAMRATVPQGEGIINGGAGEEMFTSMLDEHLAPMTGANWDRGIGEALYRQLRGAFTAQSNPEGGTE